MANLPLAPFVLPAPGFWHPQKPTSFICSRGSDDAASHLSTHPAEEPTKRASKKASDKPDDRVSKPARKRPSKKASKWGPSNPCNNRCRECALKLQFLWYGGYSEWVFVGPDTTGLDIWTWAFQRWSSNPGQTVLCVEGQAISQLDTPARDLGLKSGASMLYLGVDDLAFVPVQDPLDIQQPAFEANTLPALEANPPPAFEANQLQDPGTLLQYDQQPIFEADPQAEQEAMQHLAEFPVNVFPGLDADLLQGLGQVQQFNQQFDVDVEANPLLALDANQQPGLLEDFALAQGADDTIGDLLADIAGPIDTPMGDNHLACSAAGPLADLSADINDMDSAEATLAELTSEPAPAQADPAASSEDELDEEAFHAEMDNWLDDEAIWSSSSSAPEQ